MSARDKKRPVCKQRIAVNKLVNGEKEYRHRG